MKTNFSEITDYIARMANLSCSNNHITPDMYTEHQVYRGLRDNDGKGVVTGLTEISSVISRKTNPDGTVTYDMATKGASAVSAENLTPIIDWYKTKEG